MDTAWARHAMCESALRRESSTPRLLARRVRFAPEACLFVCCKGCVLSGKSLCLEPITPPGESYLVIEEPHRGGLGPLGPSSYKRQRLADEYTASSCCESTNEGSSLLLCMHCLADYWLLHDHISRMKLEHTVTKDDTWLTIEGMLVSLLENAPDWLGQ